MDWEGLYRRLKAHKQEHLLAHLDSLTPNEKLALYTDINDINLERVSKLWSDARLALTQQQSCQTVQDSRLKPLDRSIVGSTQDQSNVPRWWNIGLEKVSNSQVAVLLLAGGQGTRLNVAYPKGMYNVGLPSGKTLFQLQAERILKLQSLAREGYKKECIVPWYIMTSEHTKTPTEVFFRQHSYFGLQPENIVIFEQKTLPCLDFEGRIILASKEHIARAPDGNGGLYSALASNTVLDDMRRRGIESIHVYCVDNILVRMADPLFIGFCTDKGAECGAKVVKKEQPAERVGVVCCYDDHHRVVEYSEISSELSGKRNDDGTLTYSAGNICIHYFTLDFLERVVRNHSENMCHHVAKKKIPCINREGEIVVPDEPNGIKLEKFIFDVFAFARTFSVLEVLREEEFSPVKNAPGSAKDTPETAKAALLSLHCKLVLENGGNVTKGPEENGVCAVEISPLVSYAGEGLRGLCADKTFTTPIHLRDNC